jgi:WD40 repeat protein
MEGLGPFPAVNSLAFSVDGARLARGCGDGPIHVADATTGALLRTWEEEDEVVWVQFSPVNNSIVATVPRTRGSHGWSDVVSQTVSNTMITLWDVDITLAHASDCLFKPEATVADASNPPSYVLSDTYATLTKVSINDGFHYASIQSASAQNLPFKTSFKFLTQLQANQETTP